jgi:hypothetical protein
MLIVGRQAEFSSTLAAIGTSGCPHPLAPRRRKSAPRSRPRPAANVRENERGPRSRRDVPHLHANAPSTRNTCRERSRNAPDPLFAGDELRVRHGHPANDAGGEAHLGPWRRTSPGGCPCLCG